MGAEITNRNGLEKPILEIDNLTVLRSGKLVLKNVNLTVNRGGLRGPLLEWTAKWQWQVYTPAYYSWSFKGARR